MWFSLGVRATVNLSETELNLIVVAKIAVVATNRKFINIIAASIKNKKLKLRL